MKRIGLLAAIGIAASTAAFLRSFEPSWQPGHTTLGERSSQVFGASRTHFVDRTAEVRLVARCVTRG